MAEGDNQNNRHFLLGDTGETVRFNPNGGGDEPVFPRRNREQHGRMLLRQFGALTPGFEQAKAEQKNAGLEDGFGLQIEFESFPNIELAFESLARENSNIELLNVHQDGDRTIATVFVPDGKLHILKNLVKSYLDEKKDNDEGVPCHQKLLDAINHIRIASLKALWTDDESVFPEPEERLWWEVWLPVRRDRDAVVEKFRRLAQHLGFQLAKGEAKFPERTVVLIHGSAVQMQQSIMTLNSIAELRRAKETADFFDSLPPDEQPGWSQDLLQRANLPASDADVPYICILDTGVNNAHPLLASALGNQDLHTIEPAWDTNDVVGHGTEMAGLSLWGDLTPALETSEPIDVAHRLESVKLLNRNGGNAGTANHHAYLMSQAVNRPEIIAPNRARVFGMAVTAQDNRDKGRPSAWSATIDRLSVDYDNEGETPRLFVISAGNLADPNVWNKYPTANSQESIHDPGQAWNALTVGAYTKLVHVTEPDTDDYRPIAPSSGLSPFSTTSHVWETHWPLKPDVVFEGGNVADDGLGAVWMPSLSLLTTNYEPLKRLFTTTNATSAASALAARMAVRLMGVYPELKLETIRGLIVHSAEWTQAMKQQFLPNPVNPTKSEMATLVRNCGFGCPNFERALWSTENSLTLVSESSLRPFREGSSGHIALNQMNFHELPWPIKELEALGGTEVQMRVTLSYYIEPNPSSRGVKSKYRYESHGLRFDVKRPSESTEEFRTRINAEAESHEESVTRNDPNWKLGIRNRHKGSIHSDIWVGTAADLASRDMLAVYPVSGWWKTRKKLARFNQDATYTLIVSIYAPEVEVKLYTAIQNQIATVVEV